MNALTGTEKQVSWAEDIRAAKLAEVDEALRAAVEQARQETPDAAERVEAVAAEVLEYLRGKSTASYWITMRSYDADGLIAETRNDLRILRARDAARG